MILHSIQELLDSDLRAVDQYIRDSLHSEVDLINTISEHIINSGGKRTRPMLVLLSANALSCSGNDFVKLAAVIEFIHTATLLHDDVVDGSLLRRGVETANAKWGTQASVLVGDFLYSRAFQIMVSINRMEVMNILANTTNAISEGEVLQLLNAHNPDVDEENYMNVIRCKTAELFRAAMELGAIVATKDPKIILAMANYGLHFGLAYQLIDDLLDYCSAPEIMGKNVGDDLAEGKPTLPLIYAFRHADTGDRQIIANAIETGTTADLGLIQKIIEKTGALDYVKEQAIKEAKKASDSLSVLKESPYKKALLGLVDFVITRTF